MQSMLMYTVTQFVQACDHLLKKCFGTVVVQGEVSNLVEARSGHCYFSLKDEQANVRCACFKMQRIQYQQPLHNGDQIQVVAQTGIYLARGDFQLIVEQIKPVGAGQLQRQFEQLKKKLAEQGLFNPEHKLTPTPTPNTLGIITSPSGAALRDVLTTLKRRCPHVSIILYPCLVQGDQAAVDICKALHIAEQRQEVDTLILTRGGGSLEDLWPFNEEIVAQQIAQTSIPLIAGVGHETDTSIAELVADLRAPTPTAAAELACQDRHQLLQTLDHLQSKLAQALKHTTIEQHRQRLEQAQRRMDQSLHYQLTQAQYSAHSLNQRLVSASPQITTSRHHITLSALITRLKMSIRHQLKHHQQHQSALLEQIQQLSPNQTLARGYAIVTSNGKSVRSVSQLTPGNNATITLVDGQVNVTVSK